MTEKLTAADFNECDREALSRSLEMVLDGDDRGRAEQVQSFLADEECGWFYASSFCSSLCQSQALGLKPWQTAPADADEANASDAARLLKRMLSHGLSRYEPNPLDAINSRK